MGWELRKDFWRQALSQPQVEITTWYTTGTASCHIKARNFERPESENLQAVNVKTACTNQAGLASGLLAEEERHSKILC